ncbi:MAG: thiamine diphosphokinase [Christensenellaceae bacterium]|jgi:thiamine pyrophosphokinase|nr:thiamine diphosphokinase [Christensenellaceae bacterium]
MVVKSAGIILNGSETDITPKDDYIIVADAGIRHAEKLKIDIIIGDFDSINKEVLTSCALEMVTFNSDKNETDGELALRFAIKKGYKRINIYSALGGRTDHLMGNLALLSLASDLGAVAAIRDTNETIFFAKEKAYFQVPANTYISIVPFNGNALIESSLNLKYPLNNLELASTNTLGISNIALDSKVGFEIKKGRVLIFINSKKVEVDEII